MTGYGNAAYEDENFSVSVEIKALNSKFCDVNLKMPKSLSGQELEMRNLITQRLERGKINCTIDLKKNNDDTPRVNINKNLFISYYQLYKELAQELNTDQQELFKLSLQSPDVLASDNMNDDLPKKELEYLKNTLEAAILNVNDFRLSEGKTMKDELAMYIRNIDNHLSDINNIDAGRLALIRDRLRKTSIP